MLCKEVCQKCYRYHERVWDERVEIEWEEGFGVYCPVDYFNEIYSKKRNRVEKTGQLRGMFASIFGLKDILAAPPKYCEFVEEHFEKGKHL